MQEHNCVIHNNENLYVYKMNEDEKKHIEQFRYDLLSIAEILDLPKGFTYCGEIYEGRFRDDPDTFLAYHSVYGYYQIVGERGYYRFTEGTPTQDRNKAFYIIMLQEIAFSSTVYESANRDTFENLWHSKFDFKYDSRKRSFEYQISKIYEAFNKLDEELVLNLTIYLNNRYEQPIWEFNYLKMEFDLI